MVSTKFRTNETQASVETEVPWHAKHPAPRTVNPTFITCGDLLQGIQAGKRPGIDFLLIDSRRNDYEGGGIEGSLNLPAQTLYNSFSTLLGLCRNGETRKAIFYCGSSRGRGTRAAGWFDDLIADEGATGDIQSLILLDGTKGWAKGGLEYTAMMDDHVPEAWT